MTRTKDMELHEEDFEAVGEYVREHLEEWLLTTETGKAAAELRGRDIAVRESLVRLETELKGQRELLHRHMDQTEKRFEQVDKRFEQILADNKSRFEAVDRRLESLETSLRKFIYASFSFTAVVAGIIITVLKLT